MNFKKILCFGTAALLIATSGCGEKSADTPESTTVAVDENVKPSGGNIGEVKLESGDTYAVISIENFGDIKVKLFPDIAPTGVKRFTELANEGFYNGKNIHRIIPEFMFQGGSESGDGRSNKNMETFDIEVSDSARHFYGALCFANSAGKNAEQFYIVNAKNSVNLDDTVSNAKKNIEAISPQLDELKGLMSSYDESSYEYAYYASFYNQYVSQYNNMQALLKMDENASDAIKEKYKTNGGASSLDGGYTVFGQTVEGFDVIDAVSAIETKTTDAGASDYPVTEILIKSVTVGTVE